MERLEHRDLKCSTCTAHQGALQRCYEVCAGHRHALHTMSNYRTLWVLAHVMLTLQTSTNEDMLLYSSDSAATVMLQDTHATQ